MTVKHRIESLEKKSGLNDYTPILVVIQGQDFQGDDEEAGIQKKLKEKGYKRDECQILVVRFVKPNHRRLAS